MSDEVKTDETEEQETILESNNIDNDVSIDEAVEAINLAIDEEEKVKMGRPSAYEPEYHNKVAHALARAGLSEDVIASEIGISRATMFNWKKKYPDFLNAIMAGKEDADDIVKASLYQRATGYDHKAVKIFMPANAKEPVYAPYVEHVPPDVGAIKMWLTNRKPKDWKDKVDVAVDGNVSVSTIPEQLLDELSPEAKAEIALAYAKGLGKPKNESDNG
jgi:hypothetical protein